MLHITTGHNIWRCSFILCRTSLLCTHRKEMQWRPLVTGIYTANRGLWKGVRHLQTLYARGCSAAYCKNISVILLPRPTNGFYCIFMQGCCMRHVCIIFNECVIEGIFGCKTLSEWNLWKEKNHKCVVRFLKKRCSKFICRVTFAWIRIFVKICSIFTKMALEMRQNERNTELRNFIADISTRHTDTVSLVSMMPEAWFTFCVFTCSSYCGTYCRRREWWGLPKQPTERRRSEWLRLSTPDEGRGCR